jgi:deoxycytidylate deaminase
MSDDGTITIHGKVYKTVALRVSEFRESHPDWTIKSKILSAAEIVQIKATILDPDGRVIATGLAEEVRGSTNINKTSSLENCETSAVGRALAFFGLGGTFIASADEVADAEKQQAELAVSERLKAHNAALRDHIESVCAVKVYLLNDQYSAAYEAIAEIPDEDKLCLWMAPSNGGIWTTQERAAMKSDEWTAARKEYHNDN